METCPRQAVWSRKWEPVRLYHTDVLYRAIDAGLREHERTDVGEVAGEWVMRFAAERGIEFKKGTIHEYDLTIHFACLADILTTYLREGLPAWPVPGQTGDWEPRCYLLGNELVRVILVDHWSEERLEAECHSWRTLAEMAMYELPMMLKVLVIGPHHQHRRHSYWTKGFLHRKFPTVIRFKRTGRSDSRHELFAATFKTVWRENVPQFTSAMWIKAMKEQRADEEVCLTYHLKMVSREQRCRVLADMNNHITEYGNLPARPPRRYGVCDWPRVCPFRRCCWGEPETTPSPTRGRFVELSSLGQAGHNTAQ